MARRPTPEAVNSLRSALQKLEQSADSAQDAAVLAGLKRILANRIAALEIIQALAEEPPRLDCTVMSDQ